MALHWSFTGAALAHGTALESVAGFERLTRVADIKFWENPALRDLSGLSALTRVRFPTFLDNPQLETLPALGGLQDRLARRAPTWMASRASESETPSTILRRRRRDIPGHVLAVTCHRLAMLALRRATFRHV